jgi:PTS system mannose-specific IIA component
MDAIEALEEKIEQQVQALNTGQGVLIFVDLFGASPFNASARVAVRYENVDVITGMNLPMLLETTLNRESSSLQDLIATATDAGTSGVRVLKQLLKDQTDG